MVQALDGVIEFGAFVLRELRFHLGNRLGELCPIDIQYRGGHVGEHGEAAFRHFGKAAEHDDLLTLPADDPSDDAGIFDFSDERNPLADHSFVYVPYCTGDVHLGDNTQEYSPEVTIQHKGFVNGRAALDHLVATFPDAEELLVTGESAGSIPSPLFAGLASDELPDTRITVLGDGSGAYGDVPGVNAGIGACGGPRMPRPTGPRRGTHSRGAGASQGSTSTPVPTTPTSSSPVTTTPTTGCKRPFGAATGPTDPDLLEIDRWQRGKQIEATGVDLAQLHRSRQQPHDPQPGQLLPRAGAGREARRLGDIARQR